MIRLFFIDTQLNTLYFLLRLFLNNNFTNIITTPIRQRVLENLKSLRLLENEQHFYITVHLNQAKKIIR